MRKLLFVILFIFLCSSGVYASPTGVKEYVNNSKRVIIYVGDSRAMHMGNINKNARKDFVFVYSNGGGISSINPNGGSRWIGNILQRTLKKYPRAPVFFALGVNGNSNPSSNVKRTSYYDYYIRNYPSHQFIISTVGGTGKIGGSYGNKRVRAFNRLLKEKYAKNKKVWLYDCYQFLVQSKLINPGKSNKGTKDGLHYKGSVYAKILRDCRIFVQGCSK